MNVMLILGYLAFIISNSHTIESAKILVVYPLPAHSHFTLGTTLVEGLISRGHEVTFISPYPKKMQSKNRTEISVENIVRHQDEVKKSLILMDESFSLVWTNMEHLVYMGARLSQLTFAAPAVQELLHSKQTFDLVIQDYFYNDALFSLAHHYRVPLIVVSSMKPAFADHILANPTPSSYVPNILGCLTKRMDFWQRLENFLTNIVFHLLREYWNLPTQRKIFADHFRTDVELDDIIRNTSLILANSHVSTNDALPLLPNIIEVGGFHVKPPRTLPDDIQTFLDDAKDGAIIFSLGSLLRSADLKPEIKQSIIKVFGRIKQKVIWKLETEIDDLPANVKTLRWLPQNDILAHPNIRAFMTHGGVLSSIEAIYHGVPLVGIPVFGDQKFNMASAVNNGYALSIFLQEITEERLSWVLDEILNNAKYRSEAKRRSKIMQDQPMKPLDTAMFWIEYVIRHQGALQLRSAGIEMAWYKRHMLDLFALLTLGSLCLLTIIYWITRTLRKLFKNNLKIGDSKKNR